MAAARKRPELAGVSTTYLAERAAEICRCRSRQGDEQGVNIGDVYQTMQTFMGGYLVNYFNRFGRQWQVYVEAEGDYRTRAENIGQFYVRNDHGEMVPLSAVTNIKPHHRPGIHHALQRVSAPRRSTAPPLPATAPARP